MDNYDQPIESLASYELNLPNDGLKPVLRKIGLSFLIVISLFSIGLNVYLYRANLNLTTTTTLSDSELREKKFFDRYRDEIDILVFRGGSTEEGIVLDETENGVIFKMMEGTTQFGKADISKIVHNVFKKKGIPVAEELLNDKTVLAVGAVTGFVLAFSLC